MQCVRWFKAHFPYTTRTRISIHTLWVICTFMPCRSVSTFSVMMFCGSTHAKREGFHLLARSHLTSSVLWLLRCLRPLTLLPPWAESSLFFCNNELCHSGFSLKWFIILTFLPHPCRWLCLAIEWCLDLYRCTIVFFINLAWYFLYLK